MVERRSIIIVGICGIQCRLSEVISMALLATHTKQTHPMAASHSPCLTTPYLPILAKLITLLFLPKRGCNGGFGEMKSQILITIK